MARDKEQIIKDTIDERIANLIMDKYQFQRYAHTIRELSESAGVEPEKMIKYLRSQAIVFDER